MIAIKHSATRRNLGTGELPNPNRRVSYAKRELMHRNLTVTLLGLLALFATAAASAADAGPPTGSTPHDPTVSQIYDLARAGHVDQARQMMNQVLADHPNSARAYYVAAELDAELKNFGQARDELKTAEQINPGLTFANPQAVAALKQQLGGAGAPVARASAPAYGSGPVSRSFPWMWLWIGGGVALLLWLIVRRRQAAAASYTPYAGSMPSPAMGPGSVVPPAGGFPSVMPGAGSGIVGGLASGLAVGAGIAAGEELVHHVFEPGHGVAPSPEPYIANEPPAPNADMGGPDFGVSDGGGWDDGGSSGGDGGDWT